MIQNFFFIISLLAILSCGGKQATDPNVENIVQQTDGTVQNNDQIGDKTNSKNIIFFGDSLTAGFGLDEEESFPALIRKKIDSMGLNYTVVNAGLSGETSSGGKNRIDWILNQPTDIFVLELGANDMLRGLDVEETRKNLRAILESVRAKYPNAQLIVAGMQAAPNMGQDYTRKFNSIFPEIAREYRAILIPFLLQDVAAIPELNLPDGKHPNVDGQKIVANTVWKYLKGQL